MGTKLRPEELIKNSEELTGFQEGYRRVSTKLDDPLSTNDQIAAVMQLEPVLAGKVLKLANSAFFGLSRKVANVSQAVSILGRGQVGNLVLSAAIAGLLSAKGTDPDFLRTLWSHSVRCAVLCKLMGRFGNGAMNPDTLFTAGLLHDIGRLVIARQLPKEFEELQAGEVDPDDCTTEASVLGFDHTEVGAALYQAWQLPDMLVITTFVTVHAHFINSHEIHKTYRVIIQL